MRSRAAWGAAWAVAMSMAAGTTAHADDPAQAIAWLDASSAEEVQLGIETLGLSPSARAAAALVQRARRGLPPELLLMTVQTLGAMQQRESIPYLVELARHRSPQVRSKALEALTAMRGNEAVEALRRGLDDAAPEVRLTAVHGIGELADRGSLPILLRAFDRGVFEASDVIGQIGGPEEVRFLIGQLGHVPLPSILGGLGEAIRRADLPQRLRLDLVARLTELATTEVRSFFESIAPDLPGPNNDPVRRAVGDAIVRISG